MRRYKLTWLFHHWVIKMYSISPLVWTEIWFSSKDVEIHVSRKRARFFSSDHYIICVLPKVVSLEILHSYIRQRKLYAGIYSEENIQDLKIMFHMTNWDLFRNDLFENTMILSLVILNSALKFIVPLKLFFQVLTDLPPHN